MKAFILTASYNDYNQHGRCFVAWFRKSPSASQIVEALKESYHGPISKEDALDLIYGEQKSYQYKEFELNEIEEG